jgi:outer membrane protein OmpA-like peptidoglycan-associated protein
MKYTKFILTIALLLPFLASGQTAVRTAKTSSNVRIEGTVVDKISGAPLNQTRVTAFDDMLKVEIGTAYTDQNGFYYLDVPKLSRYSVKAEKATFYDTEEVLFEKNGVIKASLALGRKPGYVFDITIFDKAFEHNTINTLRDCKVEIYNNTTMEQVLTVDKLPKSTFNFSFAEGNHYTVLVRKQGYLNRRIEVYVNVNGCILCVDGMGVKEPDLVPIMSHNNEIGHFLGTIDLDSIQIGKRFQLNNIYYDFNKWNIRPEAAKTLDKVATFLKDNPGIKVELGSHTDARGSDPYNLTLSDKRARSAVDYIVAQHGIDSETITSKGYGETQLANRCDDGFSCSEYEHQLNRRTEIKITGFVDKDPLWERSLKEIIEDKELYKKIIEQEKRQKATSKKIVTK